MPKIAPKKELAALDMRWTKGTDRFLFSLSDGREIEARAVYLGWDLNRPRYVMINLGTGNEQPVPFEVPIKSYRKATADAESHIRQREGEEREAMESKYAEETARRAKVWGWEKGEHATVVVDAPPAPPAPVETFAQSVARRKKEDQAGWDAGLHKTIKPMPKKKQSRTSKTLVAKAKVVMPKRRKKK